MAIVYSSSACIQSGDVKPYKVHVAVVCIICIQLTVLESSTYTVQAYNQVSVNLTGHYVSLS